MPASLVAALWWGSLSMLGVLVATLRFTHPSPAALSGDLSARLFAAQTWLTLVCCVLLLLASRDRGTRAQAEWAGCA
jgi:Domain of unknown function (DUF4149)